MEARLQLRVQRYGWDKAAGDYEKFWSRQIEPAQKKLLEMAALRPGECVVDIACGTGLISFSAADAVGPAGVVVGTDISDAMVETCQKIARQRGFQNTTFARMDAESMDLPQNKFDAALCSLGLMYTPDPVAALRLMHRALKPGGRAVAAVWGRRDRCGWAGIFPVVDSRVKSDVCPMFFQLGTGDTLHSAMAMAGFGNIDVCRITTHLNYANADDAIGAAFVGGPVAMAYSRFDPRTREEAHAEYLESIEPYRVGEGYSVPGEFVVAAGHKERSRP